MKPSTRLRKVFALGALLALAAACSSNTADGPTSTAIVSLTVSPSVVDPSTTTPAESTSRSPTPSVIEPSISTSLDPAAQEAADRAAIEAQWITFWQVYRDMVALPVDQREKAVSTVAKSPLKEAMLDIASDANSDGIGNYGTIQHHIFFWELPVDGQSVASIGDCQDQSAAGTLDLATGSKLTTGGAKVNIRGRLVEAEKGQWLVQTLVDMGVNNC